MASPFDFDGAAAIVATMHGKKQLIEPALTVLGLHVLTAPSIDTDHYGTSTRDINRTGSQCDTLLAKAPAGLDLSYKADFSVASEGAFGPQCGDGWLNPTAQNWTLKWD